MAEPDQLRKIFVGGLHYSTTEAGLRAFYTRWGPVTECVLMTDRLSGKSRGFAFVTFANSASVDEAMRTRPHTIDGRQVEPKPAVAKETAIVPSSSAPVSKIFIGGLRDKPITRDDLYAYFSNYGQILECTMMTDKETGKPRGFAFVQFTDHDSVDRISRRRHHQVDGHFIEVKKAIPKEQIVPATHQQTSRQHGGSRRDRDRPRSRSSRPARGNWQGNYDSKPNSFQALDCHQQPHSNNFGNHKVILNASQNTPYNVSMNNLRNTSLNSHDTSMFGNHNISINSGHNDSTHGSPPNQQGYSSHDAASWSAVPPPAPVRPTCSQPSPPFGFEGYGSSDGPDAVYTSQTNTAYGFGGWACGGYKAGKDAMIGDLNNNWMASIGHTYKQSPGGGPVSPMSRIADIRSPTFGFAAAVTGRTNARPAGIIGSGRPRVRPYSDGAAKRHHPEKIRKVLSEWQFSMI